jgi:hypothetical protein
MKTTIEINDALLERAKRYAERRRTSLRSVVEDALRKEVDREENAPRFKLRDASYGLGGMNPEFEEGGWPAIRDEIYRGRGT